MSASEGRGPNRAVLGLALALPFLVAGILLGWQSLGSGCTELGDVTKGQKQFEAPPCPIVSDDFIYNLTLETTAGSITLSMDTVLACDTVNNIVFLTRAGYYDGTPIVRIEQTEDHAFVQIGDPTGTGTGTPGYTYTAEPPSPVARYVRGTAAMVFADDDPTTAGSQFFIVIEDWEELSYPARRPVNTVFGGTGDPESLRTLDVLAQAPTIDGQPTEDVRIERATITEQRRFGEEGDPVETCKEAEQRRLAPS